MTAELELLNSALETKFLVRLDSYKGANRKLVNRWSSTLHTVVGRIADDIPAYVIENDKGKQQVLHRVRLLLWSSCENEQDGLQMTAAELNIFVSLSALEPLPDGEKRCRVPYEWSFIGFGLSLACYKPMLEGIQSEDGARRPCGAGGSATTRRSWPTERSE